MNKKITVAVFSVLFTFSFLLGSLGISNAHAQETTRPPTATLEGETSYSSGEEIIHDYKSTIELSEDGTLTVQETIKVNAEHIDINHGIYRDFPTAYTDSLGFRRTVSFDILQVTRDGHDEPYTTSALTNGVRIKIGSADVIIPVGEHTFTITYRTARQVGFFSDHDELYYNVTGDAWTFPIYNAQATIKLPASIALKDVSIKGFTGTQGSTEEAVLFSKQTIGGNPTVFIQATRTLGSKEGLTFVVGFPKGNILQPSGAQKTAQFILDNLTPLTGFLISIVLTVFYIAMWYLFGRDSGNRLTVVQYEPVKDVSAGASRYLTRMGYDVKALTSSIIEMAVKGYLIIKEVDVSNSLTDLLKKKNVKVSFFGGVSSYSLELVGDNKDKLTTDQKALAEALFGSSEPGTEFTFDSTDFQSVKRVIDAYKKSLNDNFGSKYFSNRYWVIGLGVAISAIFMIMMLIDGILHDNMGGFVITVFTIFFAVAMAGSWNQSGNTNKGCVTSIGYAISAIFILIFTVVFGAILVSQISLLGSIAVISQAVLHAFFFKAIKARTKLGSDTQNAIDGFRKYITLAEEDRIKFFNKELPQDIKTYEKYLPYAVAFDAETQWTKQFQSTIDAAKEAGYQPSWYYGNNIGYFSNNFSNSFASSLSNTVSTTSVDPTSSSGFSGGGSSGGGGGGGGGGGW